MAPRKRKAEREVQTVKPQATSSRRVTRSMARQANADLPESRAELPKTRKKKGKGAEKKLKQTAKEEEKENTDTESDEKEKTNTESEAGDGSEKESDSEEDGSEPGKTIVIEHCTQSNSFKKKATQVKNGLEKGVPGITVLINPKKPRRGCFEVREEGGEKFISLLKMKPPFKRMMDLDMKKVTSDIVNKIKR